jgi:hypothetical protein
MCDSSSVICLSKNPVFHERVKHIKVSHHFLRDHIEKGDIKIKYIEIENILTKPLHMTCFASLPAGGGGNLMFAIHMAWFEGACVLSCRYSILFSSYCISFIST